MNKFKFDEKLGINIPIFEKEWEEFSVQEQLKIIQVWEKERASIPDRIKELEKKIDQLQELMYEIEFNEFIKIHEEIVDMASAINSLNIWYRTEGELTI